MALRSISLCSGVGGLDLGVGLALGRLRHLCYVEREISAARILARRMEDGALQPAPIWSDLATFDGSRFRGVADVITAGFPCPDYSVAGKREGRFGKHGQVWDHVIRIIREVGPGLVVLENVSGILVPHGAEDEEWVLPAGLHFVLGDLAESGFDAEWLCLRASDVGAPHRRERWFCVAYGSSERGRRRGSAFRQGEETSYRGIQLAHASQRGLGVCGEPSGGGGLVDGGDEVADDSQRGRCKQPHAGQRTVQVADAGCRPVVNSASLRREGLPEADEPQRCGMQDAGERSGPLANPFSAGAGYQGGTTGGRTREPDVRQGNWAACTVRDRTASGSLADAPVRLVPQPGRGPEGRDGAGSAEPPLFPPGPSDAAAWRDILERWPWLAPATEPGLRGMVDEFALVVDESRADQLRALGNGVVPLQAAVAVRELIERIEMRAAESAA